LPEMCSHKGFPLQAIRAFRSVRQRRCTWLMQDVDARTSLCSHMLRFFVRCARSADRADCTSASSAPEKAAEERFVEICSGRLLALAGNTDVCVKESLLACTLLEPWVTTLLAAMGIHTSIRKCLLQLHARQASEWVG